MDDVYRNLWSAVLKQAIEDVAKYTSGFTQKDLCHGLKMNVKS